MASIQTSRAHDTFPVGNLFPYDLAKGPYHDEAMKVEAVDDNIVISFKLPLGASLSMSRSITLISGDIIVIRLSSRACPVKVEGEHLTWIDMGLLGSSYGVYVKLDTDSCHFRFNPTIRQSDTQGFKLIPGANICASLKLMKVVRRRLIVAPARERCDPQIDKPRKTVRKSNRSSRGGLHASLINLHREAMKKPMRFPECMVPAVTPRRRHCTPIDTKDFGATPEKTKKTVKAGNSLGDLYNKCVLR